MFENKPFIHCNNIWDNTDLAFHAKALYCLLGKFANKDGYCWPSLRTLEKLSGLSRPTLVKYITELELAGEVQKVKSKTPNGDYDFNKYYLPGVVKEFNHVVKDVNHGVVNEVNQGGKGALPGVVKDVNTNYTNITNTYNYIFNHWNSKKIITHKKLTKAFQGHINARLVEGYMVEEICQAIDNYAEILKSDKYYLTHKWKLDEFLTRAFDKFKTDSDPFTTYLDKQYKQQTQQKHYTPPDPAMDELERRMKEGGQHEQ